MRCHLLEEAWASLREDNLGHTDNAGSLDAIQRLSQSEAEQMRDPEGGLAASGRRWPSSW